MNRVLVPAQLGWFPAIPKWTPRVWEVLSHCMLVLGFQRFTASWNFSLGQCQMIWCSWWWTMMNWGFEEVWLGILWIWKSFGNSGHCGYPGSTSSNQESSWGHGHGVDFQNENDGDPGTLQFGWRHLGLLKWNGPYLTPSNQCINVDSFMNGCSCCHFGFGCSCCLTRCFLGAPFCWEIRGGGFLNVLPFLAMINMNIYSNPAS